MERPCKKFKSLEGYAEGANNAEGAMFVSIGSLPEDIIENILGRVGNKSLCDLFNSKFVCKLFCNIFEKPSVFKAVLLSKFTVQMVVHDPRKSKFLQLCLANNNTQALYNGGLVDFFFGMEVVEGIRKLKAAADGGYKKAVYVYALVHLTLGFECEGRLYFSRLLRDEARAVHHECSFESCTIWEGLLPEKFAENCLNLMSRLKLMDASVTSYTNRFLNWMMTLKLRPTYWCVIDVSCISSKFGSLVTF